MVEQSIVHGGKNIYGYDIGIIMLKTVFPRIIGDVGNAKTWKYPVMYEVVDDIPSSKVVLHLTESDISPFIAAAKKLEYAGVKVITTSCGFLSFFQEKLTKIVNIPVFTSTLVLLPMILRLIPDGKKILILTANAVTLTAKHFDAVGVRYPNKRIEVAGTQNMGVFTNFTVENWLKVDTNACRNDIFTVLDNTSSIKDNSIGAIVLECTNMSPYSNDIKKRYNVPVFDFISMMNFVYETICISGGII